MREYSREHRSHSKSLSCTKGQEEPSCQHHDVPPPYKPPRKSSTWHQHFQEGTNWQIHAICAICLRIYFHNVARCSLSKFWDGSKARCWRNEDGQIINPLSQILCIDWQRSKGCSARDHNQHHECSGCRKQDHGAQQCPRAQKE